MLAANRSLVSIWQSAAALIVMRPKRLMLPRCTTHKRTFFATFCVAVLSTIVFPGNAVADPIEPICREETLENAHAEDATSLHVRFDKKVDLVAIQTATGPIIKRELDPDNMGAQFTGENFPIPLQPGLHVTIRFCTDDFTGVLIDKTRSAFDVNNIEVVGSVAAVGVPPKIGFDEGSGLAFAAFFNPEVFAINYSDISIFTDNNLSNLNVGDAFTPTGTLVSGIPTMLSLDPGGLGLLFYPVSSRSGYDLILATASAASNPFNRFVVAEAAATVPESSTIVLTLCGVLCLCLARCREVVTCFLSR